MARPKADGSRSGGHNCREKVSSRSEWNNWPSLVRFDHFVMRARAISARTGKACTVWWFPVLNRYGTTTGTANFNDAELIWTEVP